MEELLQQSCDYRGIGDEREFELTAGRTFPARNATIGQAYKCRRIIRSRSGVMSEALIEAMKWLEVDEASRAMSKDVSFVLAIPILEPERPSGFTAPCPVAGVIYIDSKAPGFFISDAELAKLVKMADEFVAGLERMHPLGFNRIRNVPLTGLGKKLPPAADLKEEVSDVLEIVDAISPPRSDKPFQFNFDYSDFVPVPGFAQ